MNANEMMSVEEALECVLSHVQPLEAETIPLLEAVGRVAAEDLRPCRDGRLRGARG